MVRLSADRRREPAGAASPKRKVVFASVMMVAGLVCGLGLAEAGLRAAGFSSQALPTLMFGWPVAKVLVNQYKPDRDMYWVPHDYTERLAAARTEPPAIVFLGDSCTEFGKYPDVTLQRMAEREPALATGVKLGVAGWSTVQGLAQLRRDVLPLKPRVVTIYFGWNDHWLAIGPPDAEARLTPVGWWLSQHTRFYQLWMKARLIAVPNDLAKRPVRVPLSLYETNLREMVRLVREQGGTAVLITAPAGHERGQEPKYLAQQHIARLTDVVPLHSSYPVRRGARVRGAPRPERPLLSKRRCPFVRRGRCPAGRPRRVVHSRLNRKTLTIGSDR
jgi:lysophospholipase L1-like esterase